MGIRTKYSGIDKVFTEDVRYGHSKGGQCSPSPLVLPTQALDSSQTASEAVAPRVFKAKSAIHRNSVHEKNGVGTITSLLSIQVDVEIVMPTRSWIDGAERY